MSQFDEYFTKYQKHVPAYHPGSNQPVVDLYLKCLEEDGPPASQNVWTVAGHTIYITDEFRYMGDRIDAVWASHNKMYKKESSVTLRGHPHIGTSTFLRYLLMKEACASRPVVLFAFNQWFLLTPRLGAFHFNRIEDLPRFAFKFYNNVLCLVDTPGSDSQHPSSFGLDIVFDCSGMRIVQVCSGVDYYLADWPSRMTDHFVMNPPSMHDIQQILTLRCPNVPEVPLAVVRELYDQCGPNLWLMQQKIAPNNTSAISSTSLALISPGYSMSQPPKYKGVLQREETLERDNGFLRPDGYVFFAADVLDRS